MVSEQKDFFHAETYKLQEQLGAVLREEQQVMQGMIEEQRNVNCESEATDHLSYTEIAFISPTNKSANFREIENQEIITSEDWGRERTD